MRPTLLIVEDDDAIRAVWQVLFACRGWRVIAASTVAEGLAKLDPVPDSVILDLNLPDGRGETILQHIREHGLKTHVVVTTGASDAPTVDSLQPEALFRKPFNVADVWREALHALA